MDVWVIKHSPPPPSLPSPFQYSPATIQRLTEILSIGRFLSYENLHLTTYRKRERSHMYPSIP